MTIQWKPHLATLIAVVLYCAVVFVATRYFDLSSYQPINVLFCGVLIGVVLTRIQTIFE